MVGIVVRRLRAAGGGLDVVDVEACYAIAWQGLYGAVLDGQEISNPTGWLVLATHRRAIDEQRARRRAERGTERTTEQVWPQEPDLAGELDDRDRLRELFEGVRSRLEGQEREAAVLCYLHGLTRAEAAARMGVSERRMRRLMEGRGPGRPGVSEKLGELATTIGEGRWCEQQGSLMRGFAFGILDRDGERYRLALAHSSRCSSCRAYVASLRGLASVLPPVLAPGGIAASILSRVGEGAGTAAAHSGAAAGSSGAALGGGAPVTPVGGGALGGAGAVGGGGASGGWVLAGPLGAKVAAGCLVALGVGAGCAGLGGVALHGARPGVHARRHAGAAARRDVSPWPGTEVASGALGADPAAGSTPTAAAADAGAGGSEQADAAREFGPEQALAARSTGSGTGEGSGGRASTASVHRSARRARAGRAAAGEALAHRAGTSEPPAEASGAAASPGAEPPPTPAAREFSPG